MLLRDVVKYHHHEKGATIQRIPDERKMKIYRTPPRGSSAAQGISEGFLRRLCFNAFEAAPQNPNTHPIRIPH
jgi:hypothetical protein